MKDDTEYYTYDELKKSRLPGFMFSGVAIRTSWIRRCRRYAVHKGLNIELLGRFIKKRLSDRNEADFRDKALDENLTPAQQWVLMSIILNENGVPDHLRDKESDENAPVLIFDEPDEPSSVASVATGAITGAASAVAEAATKTTQATTGAISGAAGATSDVVKGVATAAGTPVKSLKSLVSSEELSSEAPEESVTTEESTPESVPESVPESEPESVPEPESEPESETDA